MNGTIEKNQTPLRGAGCMNTYILTTERIGSDKTIAAKGANE